METRIPITMPSPDWIITNEKFHDKMLNFRMYMWKDTGNIYHIKDGKFCPDTLKGYVELAAIVSRDYMDEKVVFPRDNEMKMSKSAAWHLINQVR
jgi:hypothetical protein